MTIEKNYSPDVQLDKDHFTLRNHYPHGRIINRTELHKGQGFQRRREYRLTRTNFFFNLNSQGHIRKSNILLYLLWSRSLIVEPRATQQLLFETLKRIKN